MLPGLLLAFLEVTEEPIQLPLAINLDNREWNQWTSSRKYRVGSMIENEQSKVHEFIR